MRGAARGLIVGILASSFLTPPVFADGAPGFERAVRELDGGQFLEDEPIWLCDDGEPQPGASDGLILHGFRIVGFDERGRRVPPLFPPRLLPPVWAMVSKPALGRSRAGEFVHTLGLFESPTLHRLVPWRPRGGGLPAGTYEVRRGDWGTSVVDTAAVLARFRVIVPRGSELAVRAALARAARLASSPDTTHRADAARLYEAVLARYPRTSYWTIIYAGLWRVRAQTPYGVNPGAWLDEIFAHFHSACFGVWALDVFMHEMPQDEARVRLRRLVGLYPDTKLARAAARYL